MATDRVRLSEEDRQMIRNLTMLLQRDQYSKDTAAFPGEASDRTIMGWDLDPPDNLAEAVGQAVGRASMCWKQLPNSEFNSDDASKIIDELVSEVNKFIADKPKRYVVTAIPTQVTVMVGDRRLGAFTQSPSGEWRPSGLGSHDWSPSLVEAIHDAMQRKTWDDLTDVPIQVDWDLSVVRPSTEDEDPEDEDWAG